VEAYYVKIAFGAMNLACIGAFLYQLNRVAGVKNSL